MRAFVVHQADGQRLSPEKGDMTADLSLQFLTIREAAEILGLTYVQLQRAIRRGIVPSYRPFGRRILVRLSEVVAAIEAAKIGGAE